VTEAPPGIVTTGEGADVVVVVGALPPPEAAEVLEARLEVLLVVVVC